jgi:hypothetical protein
MKFNLSEVPRNDAGRPLRPLSTIESRHKELHQVYTCSGKTQRRPEGKMRILSPNHEDSLPFPGRDDGGPQRVRVSGYGAMKQGPLAS